MILRRKYLFVRSFVRSFVTHGRLNSRSLCFPGEVEHSMSKSEESGSPGWRASFSSQITEDLARAVSAAATSVHSTRPSVVFSSKESHSGSQLQKLQRQVSRVLNLKGFSNHSDVKIGTYNPEILTSQKRQWARFQLQSLDHRSLKQPSRLFESMVVVGLHPNCDIQALQKRFFERKSEGSGKLHQSRIEPNLEPQVLFAYPAEKQLPLKYKDLLSFCFPGGVEVHAVERTPSMSEINEILLGQEHLKQSNLSFVFRLQVADNSSLYGCCILVEELLQKPVGLISMILDKKPPSLARQRRLLTTRRCYCILSRLPFFELHFGVLNSMFIEERLERLTKGIDVLDLEKPEGYQKQDHSKDQFSTESAAVGMLNGISEMSQFNIENSCPVDSIGDSGVIPFDPEGEVCTPKKESGAAIQLSKATDINVDYHQATEQTLEKHLQNAVFPLLHCQQFESSDSSPSFQGSPNEDGNFRSDMDETETEEASSSGQEDITDNSDIIEWAKANNHGSLRIICEYYQLRCPFRGSTLTFHPLEHLHPVEFHRPDKTVLRIAGSLIDLKSCSTSLEFAEAHSALLAEEEATALSVWAVACLCGSLRLENVLTMLAGALLEKQIVIVCSNLGILSASVLSIIPLIRPYQWQSLLMPVLPNDMLDFLDAPVPYIVGVKNKTSEVQSKLTNVIMVDANKNQVRSPSLPQLPQQKELLLSLGPYHAKLVGESYLGRKRPVYECTDVQIEASKGFLDVIRSYLDSLCSNLRSHTITNVQSNDDKVSLLLKESFIESFPSRDRPFMKHFLDTQQIGRAHV